MNYYDLCVADAKLVSKAVELGFSKAIAARVVSLRKSVDVPTREDNELVIVESENLSLLVEACRRGRFALLNPTRFPYYYKDDELLAAAKDKKRVFEIPLRPLLHASFVNRAKALNQLRFFLRRCVKRGVPFVFTSRAEDEFDLKSPREVAAIGFLVGLSREQASAAVGFVAEEVLGGLQ
ncbi:MAG: RNase P subunit p30 family protein [Candidatus Micrarchaeia archaeon]|jgi:RNase P/RNase MRP subunit p30